MTQNPTSDAKASLFFSPPEIPLILPGTPIMTSAHLFKPTFKAIQNYYLKILN